MSLFDIVYYSNSVTDTVEKEPDNQENVDKERVRRIECIIKLLRDIADILEKNKNDISSFKINAKIKDSKGNVILKCTNNAIKKIGKLNQII